MSSAFLEQVPETEELTAVRPEQPSEHFERVQRDKLNGESFLCAEYYFSMFLEIPGEGANLHNCKSSYLSVNEFCTAIQG